MSDTFRQVGDDETGDTYEHFTRRLKIGSKVTATYEREGERAALLASRPERGDVLETIGTTPMYVTEVSIEDLGQGDMARMTVLTESATEEETGELAPLGEPEYTVEFSEIRMKIEAHPCMGKLSADAIDDGKSFENWQELKDSDWLSRGSSEAFPLPPPFWNDFIGPWALADFKEMKSRGVEEFIMYLPVITRTLHYLGRPTGVGDDSGTVQFPPAGIYGHTSSYEWLQGPDNLNRRGSKYERKTSWTAADYFHPRIYVHYP